MSTNQDLINYLLSVKNDNNKNINQYNIEITSYNQLIVKLKGLVDDYNAKIAILQDNNAYIQAIIEFIGSQNQDLIKYQVSIENNNNTLILNYNRNILMNTSAISGLENNINTLNAQIAILQQDNVYIDTTIALIPPNSGDITIFG